MASSPTATEILARFYEAESIYLAAPPHERDFANGMATVLSPDFELYQSPDLPHSQSLYEGHAGLLNWSEEMAALVDQLKVADPKFFEREGADEVVVISVLKLRTREGGRKTELPLLQIVSVDREKGWITSTRPFYWDVAGLRGLVGRED
ncbi:uncharacterized protein LTR77_010918 [Saxophila tyrrhenica]|uniref:SnoaL-like domain-containing protein n=1 Tax=Saxophila tyrrhenica TaxID=1690608 RepID=A0AAV9NU32_9PEZI|nr:hypothetical protein LTR77_010918 [Saxophila tyrrhenica]